MRKRLQHEGIIKPVQFAKWAAPVVPILKPDGSVRLCGDFKQTINRYSQLDKYPIPRIEDLYAKLAGGPLFTKLDTSHAYLQLWLDEDSQRFATINTLKGLFQYKRLPFGVSSACAIFQRTMESILQGLPFTKMMSSLQVKQGQDICRTWRKFSGDLQQRECI